MKKNLKRLLPYVILNALIYSVAGAIIGKNYAEIRNTSRKLNADNEALEKYLGGLIKQAEESGKVVQLSDFLEDHHDPIEPTIIYVYD